LGRLRRHCPFYHDVEKHTKIFDYIISRSISTMFYPYILFDGASSILIIKALCRSGYAEDEEIKPAVNSLLGAQRQTEGWRRNLSGHPIYSTAVRGGIESLSEPSKSQEALKQAQSIIRSIKMLMKDLYDLPVLLEDPLSMFAQAMHNNIEDEVVKRQTLLDW